MGVDEPMQKVVLARIYFAYIALSSVGRENAIPTIKNLRFGGTTPVEN
jgi:hypothetical protein